MHEPVESAATDVPPSPPRRGFSRWGVVLAALVLVLGPLLGGGLKEERARWRIAAGLEAWLDGDLAEAIAQLDAAAALSPDHARIYVLRAQWKIYHEDYAGALRDAERYMELAPIDLQGFQLKADALVHLDRPEEAAEAWLAYIELLEEYNSAIAPALVNGVAYYRALAKQDLATALTEIETAIARERNRSTWSSGSQAAFLDTRGYILFLRKEYHPALEDMNAAVAAAERQRQAEHTQTRLAVGMGALDPRVAAWQTKQVDRTLAVLHYHRALLLEAMGRKQAAGIDYRRIAELGFEPGPHLF